MLAFIVLAYIVLAYIVLAYIVLASRLKCREGSPATRADLHGHNKYAITNMP